MKTFRVAGVAAALVTVIVATLVAQSNDSVAQISATAPIGPRTATALGMTFAPAASAAGVTVADANKAALGGWPLCTVSGTTSFLRLGWSSTVPPTNADVFMVPLSCPYGNDSSLSSGSTATTPKANFKIAIVSATGHLLETVTGVSLDTPTVP